jgi:hypothetical protein
MACLLAAVLWAPRGLASDEYPQIISEELATPCIPTCTLCHLTNQGGQNTSDASKPFLLAMLGAGLLPGSPDLLRTALTTLASNMTDSDGDGMADTEELAQERNPNEFGEGQLCGGPTYGCGARIARGRSLDVGAFGAALGVALALAFARKREQR